MNVNKKFWDKSFKNNLKDQRFFPNEELCRFLGRNFNVKKKNKFIRIGLRNWK